MVVLDVGDVAAPDLATVEALARLVLAARRLGFSCRLRGTPPALDELLEFVGVRDAIRDETI